LGFQLLSDFSGEDVWQLGASQKHSIFWGLLLSQRVPGFLSLLNGSDVTQELLEVAVGGRVFQTGQRAMVLKTLVCNT
jgi:hypothetical protein